MLRCFPKMYNKSMCETTKRVCLEQKQTNMYVTNKKHTWSQQDMLSKKRRTPILSKSRMV